MTNARERIPKRARAVAEKVLHRCDAEKKSSPMVIFTEELLVALQAEFETGFKIGKKIGLSKKLRQAKKAERN